MGVPFGVGSRGSAGRPPYCRHPSWTDGDLHFLSKDKRGQTNGKVRTVLYLQRRQALAL
jgi:hypothetical protein